MASEKKLESPVTLFAAIEEKQHTALREIAFKERRSLADVVRESLDAFLQAREKGTRPQRRHAHAR
jgi:hypothetical protein